jgi:hypothetical protein
VAKYQLETFQQNARAADHFSSPGDLSHGLRGNFFEKITLTMGDLCFVFHSKDEDNWN